MTDSERNTTVSLSQRNPFEGKIEEFVTMYLDTLYLIISYLRVARSIPCKYMVFYNNVLRKKRNTKHNFMNPNIKCQNSIFLSMRQ